MCKFTPLGFETVCAKANKGEKNRVSLPRWGLKLHAAFMPIRRSQCVNLPRWGLKLGL